VIYTIKILNSGKFQGNHLDLNEIVQDKNTDEKNIQIQNHEQETYTRNINNLRKLNNKDDFEFSMEYFLKRITFNKGIFNFVFLF